MGEMLVQWCGVKECRKEKKIIVAATSKGSSEQRAARQPGRNNAGSKSECDSTPLTVAKMDPLREAEAARARYRVQK